MKTRYLLLWILVTLSVISCYDDKGNYDYSDLNRISIGLWDNTPSVAMGDTFRLEPQLQFAIDSVNVNLEYEWTFDDKVIGTERNLNWIVDTTGRANMVLRIKDLDNEMVYMSSEILIISSVYTSGIYDFMILSEKDGKSLLSFARTLYNDDTGEYYWQILENIYEKENGEELGSQPLFIREHIADIAYSEGHVTIFQEGGQGSVDLDGISMKKDINLIESFSGQTYPENFHPVDAELMSWVHLILNEDGKVYSKIKETQELFQSGYYIHTPLLFENKEIRADMIIPMRKTQDKHYALLHEIGTAENPENRLIVVYNYKEDFYDLNSAGKVLPMPEPAYGWPTNFVPLTDMGENELLHVGYMAYGWSEGDAAYGIFLKTPEGKYLYQYVEIEEDYGTDDLSYVQNGTGEELKVWEINSPIPLEECTFWTLPSQYNQYVFIAHGKDIYFLSVETPGDGIRHYYTCESNVVAMSGQDYSGLYMMVGLENGRVLVLNVASAKNILDDAEKLLWESPDNIDLGKIVDLSAKVGTAMP